VQLAGYADADWGSETKHRKSKSGYIFTLGTGAISYGSKLQSCVAQSTCEAEYISTADATPEAIYIRQVLGEIQGVPITDTATIWEDKQSTIAYSQSAPVSDKTIHIGLKYFFIKDHLAQGTIHPRYLPTTEIVADTLTKPLHGPTLYKHTAAMMGAARPMRCHILKLPTWGML
jgi:hypothetical protein